MSAKPYDMVVFGATAFTGQLIARHLVTEPESALGAPDAVKWALAARNADKLASLKTKLKSELPEVDAALIDAIPVIIVDSKDEASLRRMAEQTKVVISLVGPYRLFGELLVKVCAELGVHYCDLTGEMFWARDMTQKYASVAEATGAIMVHSCGVDSVPSDLAAYLLASRIRETRSEPTGKVEFFVTGSTFGVGGGSAASFVQMVEDRTTAELKESINPFLLTDEKTMKQKESEGLVARNGSHLGVQYNKPLGIWSSFYIMDLINRPVVHRSNFLLNNQYGDNFVYSERLAIGGLLAQLAGTAVTMIFSTMMYFDWTRKLIKMTLPGAGEGPSEDVMTNGCFFVDALGYTEKNELAAKLICRAPGDPGYRVTLRILSECAFCLAKRDFREIGNGETAVKTGGFYTPATAFGDKLSSRLDKKKFMTFDLQSVGPVRSGKQEEKAPATAF